MSRMKTAKYYYSYGNKVRFAATCPYQSKDRELAIVSFCRSFVPSDVSEDDVQHFSGNLINDAVSTFMNTFVLLSTFLI